MNILVVVVCAASISCFIRSQWYLNVMHTTQHYVQHALWLCCSIDYHPLPSILTQVTWISMALNHSYSLKELNRQIV